MTQTKKMLSVFLSFVLAMAMVPSIAFAAESNAQLQSAEGVVEVSATTEASAPAVDAGAKARATGEVYASIPSNAYAYTGSAIRPVPTVWTSEDLGGETLVKDVDYTVTYIDNVNPGYGIVRISLVGDISFEDGETLDLTFYIGEWFKDGAFGTSFVLWYEGDVYSWFEDEWAVIDGKTYYFEGYYRATGWRNDNSGHRYYFSTSTGAMAKGIWKIGGYRYYFNPTNGYLRTGLWTVSGKTYYFNPSSSPKGRAASGWKTIGGKTYYFNKTTNAANKGIWKVAGKKYYFNSKGVRQTGWWTISGKKYYFRPGTSPKGQAYSTAGVRTIGGKKYYFYANGHCARNAWVKGHYYNSLGQRTK